MLSLPGPLVSVDWLAAHLTDTGLRIADVRWSLSAVRRAAIDMRTGTSPGRSSSTPTAS